MGHLARVRPAAFWTGLVIALALGKGMLDVWSRPWSVCDEPGHLEHVLYVVEHRRLPDSADLDIALRQRVSDAYRGADCSQDLPGSIAGCLGYHQLEERHAYYAMQALVQLLVGPDTVLGQLRLARCVSLLLLLLTLVVAHAATTKAFPGRPLLAAAVTAVMATLPSYSGLMTTVNNDALACLAGGLLVLSAIALLRSGPTARGLLVLVLAAALCAASKTTSMLLLPAAAAALWLALPLRPAAHALAAVAVGLVLLSLVDLRGSAHWLKPRYDHVDRTSTDARLGSHALLLRPGYVLAQRLPPAETAALRGAPVTLGAWMRAPGGDVAADPPRLDLGGPAADPGAVVLGREWRFVAWSTRVPAEAATLGVRLTGPASGIVEVDGVALVRGDLADAGPPAWLDDDAANGSWGGGDVRNLLRNASAERGWPLLRDVVDARVPLVGGLNWRVQSLYAWRLKPGYYRKAIDRFLVTFWESFAWRTPTVRRFAVGGSAALFALAVGGLLLGLADALRGRRVPTSVEIRILAFLSLTVLIALAGTLARTDPPKPGDQGYLPGARYFFVALVPAAILLVLGLGRWLPPRVRPWGLAALAASLYLGDLFGR